MSTQLEKILNFAEKNLGSSYWYGYCQAFVARCYEAGTGVFVSCESANVSRSRYMKRGTQTDLCPPAGAAVYFYGDGEKGKRYGHVALSAGNGWIYDPVSRIVKCRLSSGLHNGYFGWGWLGGSRPEGCTDTSSGQSSQKSKEITTIRTVSEYGNTASRAAEYIADITENDFISILIQNGEQIFYPAVVGNVSLVTSKTISAAVLKFSVKKDSDLKVENGCPVAMRYRGIPLFYGYIFEMRSETTDLMTVTCYDQLRYLKNKDSFIYSLTYSDLLKFIANKYKLKMGVIEDTAYVIPTMAEEDTLLDILKNASEQTMLQTGETYVLYDDFGKLTLKNIRNMVTNIYLDSDCFASAVIRKSIDRDVFNRIVIAVDHTDIGERSLYVANDAATQEKWGILQRYERIDPQEDTTEQIKKLAQIKLKTYDTENNTLSIKGALGNPVVRGGSSVVVKLPDSEKAVYMICEKVEHLFDRNGYFMNLELSGGGFAYGSRG